MANILILLFLATMCKTFYRFLNVSYVYGLLLFSKYYHYLIETRTYIRLLSGDAIS
jgi:hypothetical protein